MPKLITDPRFKVSIDPNSKQVDPDLACWAAMHRCVDGGANAITTSLNPVESVIKHALKFGHWDVLHHASIKLDFDGFPHSTAMQFRTHRQMSVLVQCLTADTVITFVNKKGIKNNSEGSTNTIGKLFDQWENGGSGIQSPAIMKTRIKKRRLRCLNEETGEFAVGHIKDIFETGINPVYRIKTTDGYEVTSTLNHKYWTHSGWQTLGDLAGIVTNKLTGNIDRMFDELPMLSTNGVIVGEGCYQQKEWLQSLLANGLTSFEIAEEAGTSVETIKKWVYRHGLVLNNSRLGKTPWNKGMDGEYNLTMTESRRRSDKEKGVKRRGKNSIFWKGGTSDFRTKVGNWAQTQKIELKQKFNNKCCYCQGSEDLEIDHILPVFTHPSLAYTFENLQLLCYECHKNKTAWDTRLVPKWSQIESIEFAGFQPTYDIEMAGSHHSFIANGFVVHNSLRYAEERFTACADGDVDPRELFYFRPMTDKRKEDLAYARARRSCRDYAQAIEDGQDKETARDNLLCNYRQGFTMSGTFCQWMHVLDRRLLADTQLEAQTAAWMALDQLRGYSGFFEWYRDTRAGKNMLSP